MIFCRLYQKTALFKNRFDTHFYGKRCLRTVGQSSSNTIVKVKPTVIDLAYWLANLDSTALPDMTMLLCTLWDEKAQNLKKKSDAYHYQLSLGRYKKQIPLQCPVTYVWSSFFPYYIWIFFSFPINYLRAYLAMAEIVFRSDNRI